MSHHSYGDLTRNLHARLCMCVSVCAVYCWCLACRMWVKYNNIVSFNNITFQVPLGTHTRACARTHTRTYTYKHADEVGRFHLDLATIPVAMGRWETVPTSVTMTTRRQRTQGLFTVLVISSSVCESATKYYERLQTTGPETHLYVNIDTVSIYLIHKHCHITLQ